MTVVEQTLRLIVNLISESVETTLLLKFVIHYLFNLNFDKILIIFESLIKRIDSNNVYLALGGGIGISYFSEESPFELNKIKNYIKDKLTNLSKNTSKRIIHILELGSYLVADAGYYFTKIIDKKNLRGKIAVIANGGINHNLSSGSRSSWEHRCQKEHYPLRIFSERDNKYLESNDITCDIYGPTCTGADILARNASIPNANIDDYIVIEKSGAYGLTDSLVLFLSHGLPAEYLLDEDEIYCIKPFQHGVEYLEKTFNSLKLTI